MQMTKSVPAVKTVGPDGKVRLLYPVILPALDQAWNGAVARLVAHG